MAGEADADYTQKALETGGNLYQRAKRFAAFWLA
jgi:hypothetical protein